LVKSYNNKLRGSLSFLRSSQFLSQSRNLPQFIQPAVHCYSHKNLPPVPIMSQINPVHTLPSYFYMAHFNIIVSSMPRSSKWSVSFRFPH